MKCELCGGEVEKKMVSYILFYEGHWVIVDKVPAKVCKQCGEKLFSPEVVENLQKIIWSKQKPIKKVETPVFELV
ncbi:MAG: YgiT-type zinc finger protein [Candidatus Omnitrophica bacterium]|nr:YgiT-type zinc finger protein [Candidatus Omnitrophota bacterium]